MEGVSKAKPPRQPDDAVRVLIVDDNAEFRSTTSRVLSMLQYEVIGQAKNGADAVAQVESLRPDLVLMDVEMPEMNGIEAARRIQRTHPTPVVLLTAYDSLDVIREARDAGVAAYLVKPLDARELQRTITIALARFEDWMALRRLNRELKERNAQLKKALETINTLHGLLPVCAWCGKKIETEEGEWVSLTSYIENHSEATITHGICPDCLPNILPKKKH
jgi:AmiR/NasT family two-component response regulator